MLTAALGLGLGNCFHVSNELSLFAPLDDSLLVLLLFFCCCPRSSSFSSSSASFTFLCFFLLNIIISYSLSHILLILFFPDRQRVRIPSLRLRNHENTPVLRLPPSMRITGVPKRTRERKHMKISGKKIKESTWKVSEQKRKHIAED